MTPDELRASARALILQRYRIPEGAPVQENPEMMIEALLEEVNDLRRELMLLRIELYDDK